MTVWGWIYAISLALTLALAIRGKDKDYILMTVLMIFCHINARIVLLFNEDVQPTLDLLNDFIICILLVKYLSEHIVARVLLILYALMALFAYLPAGLGLLPQDVYFIIIDVFFFGMLLVIIGGISSGSRVLDLSDKHPVRDRHFTVHTICDPIFKILKFQKIHKGIRRVHKRKD